MKLDVNKKTSRKFKLFLEWKDIEEELSEDLKIDLKIDAVQSKKGAEISEI